MRELYVILKSSLSLTWQEFKSHKSRTILSLTGVALGIFCIISVLATIQSLEYAIKKDIEALGKNTIYIDKWNYGNEEDYPWWKYMKRPDIKTSEARLLEEKVDLFQNVTMYYDIASYIQYGNDRVNNVRFYGVEEPFFNIQNIKIAQGRTLTDMDFDQATNNVIMGSQAATDLFGSTDRALGKTIRIKNGKLVNIIGIIEKQGKSILQAFDFDNCIILSTKFMRSFNSERASGPVIIVQAKENIPTEYVLSETRGAMRAIRRLEINEDDDFSLNDIEGLASFFDDVFFYMNLVGWGIAALSLVVGMFGVANIMFVTVKERTSQIGLKKAIGAKNSIVLTEFLLESAFMCIIGGAIGLSMVVLIAIAANLMGFTFIISLNIILLALTICIVVGVCAGIIPARNASRMDPVKAIRS
ncbi:ABC transporter permease [Gynurincola endophyticus]|uniref:ABC transporter permease n=1 Tax=Gynurincola endophyticus TaxID=2479004 RepID=UPI000F8C8A3C|nr:ABC transporter permease [Gynurincola endophyticus]